MEGRVQRVSAVTGCPPQAEQESHHGKPRHRDLVGDLVRTGHRLAHPLPADNETYGLVQELRAFLDTQTVPYVVGNDDGELQRVAEDKEIRVDYNAAILFDKGRIVDTYRKLHLVPFTESFPFKKQLPGIYDWLVNADTHFWEQGKVYTVFEADGVRFSTPICFEDTFGYLCRGFIRHGAQVLVNMTNDAWSFSVPCAMQHMTMAVFRAVENRRSVVRSDQWRHDHHHRSQRAHSGDPCPIYRGLPDWQRACLYGHHDALHDVGGLVPLVAPGPERCRVRLRHWKVSCPTEAEVRKPKSGHPDHEQPLTAIIL